MAPWNPDSYLTFKKERFAPFEDILPLTRVRPWMKVVDLGCGTGELTRRLADRLPDSDVVGIDTSDDMLAEAHAFERLGLRFERRDLRDLEGEWDLIFSHATIHWVEDHHTLIRELFSHTAPEGQLALQFPSNHHHAAHKLVLETASEEPFKTALGGWKWVYPLLPVAAYAEILYEAGAEDLRVFEKVYPHVMDNADALAAWLVGTTLVPYLERMDDVTKEYFMQVIRSKLRRLWPSGPLFYPFRRIFVSAVKPEVIS